MRKAIEDQVYDPHFTKQFRPRRDAFKREFNLTVYAVGTTVEKALAALAEANKWGEIENVEFQPVDVPANWYVRFVADGTGMKAAGEYLTGGVIVTWWK